MFCVAPQTQERIIRLHLISVFEDMINRGCGKVGRIIPSGRGTAYCAKDCRKLISKHEVICSMGRKGGCWDNAPMKSLCDKVKSEWLSDEYDTINEAKRDVYEYVWHFYPRERPHQSLDYLTSVDYYKQANCYV